KASSSRLQLEGLTLTSGAGSLSAWGAAQFLSPSAALDFSARSYQFPLQPGLLLDGETKLGGTAERPELRSRLTSASAEWKGERFEQLSLALDLTGGEGAAALSLDWRGLKGLK